MAKPTTFAAILLSLSIAAVSACSSNRQASTEPGTTPATGGSPAPSTPATNETPSADTLTAQLKTAAGRPVATDTFQFANGYATVTVKTTTTGILTPGFHDMHIHSVGKCKPNSVAPTGGPPGDFLSAGPHYQAPGHSGQPASGDLSSTAGTPGR